MGSPDITDLMGQRLRDRGYAPQELAATLKAMQQADMYNRPLAPLIVNGVTQEEPRTYRVRRVHREAA